MKKRIRTLTFYLPQFHRVTENDEWWGEGFTEWTALRKAEPLYEGHKQPIRPLNNYYYNLLEKSTMEWQSSLMKKYGIDGQCFYHYYFKDGRKIFCSGKKSICRFASAGQMEDGQGHGAILREIRGRINLKTNRNQLTVVF